ncbi:MAG: hypothetical protein GTO53_13320, partial [Planctomycetales bacterium]|nr:hypothetical protein [Planctomycetales bacterium]NIM10075.1 hypothetical protein [Planctomycetales bacterium]NIN09516.1 hypothetical protein [Planctomycetales bacterium]NIN78627.1 hypothetical protein [Planctomycetales bacterium]NIO35821.1 hypothetical protein [Planctomycetales bacterium]
MRVARIGLLQFANLGRPNLCFQLSLTIVQAQSAAQNFDGSHRYQLGADDGLSQGAHHLVGFIQQTNLSARLVSLDSFTLTTDDGAEQNPGLLLIVDHHHLTCGQLAGDQLLATLHNVALDS